MSSKNPDLVPQSLPDGGGGVSAEMINNLVRHAQDEATRASKWYFVARSGKKWGALWLRSLAIVLASLVAAVPIINEIAKAPIIRGAANNAFEIPLATSSLLLVIAGLCVGIDRLFGFSTSWARYAETGLRIGALLHEFQLKEQLLRIQWADQPTVDQGRASIELIQSFVTSLDQLVMAETHAWIQDFQQGLSRLDAQLERSSAGSQTEVKPTVKPSDPPVTPTPPSPTPTPLSPTPTPAPPPGPPPTPGPTPPATPPPPNGGGGPGNP